MSEDLIRQFGMIFREALRNGNLDNENDYSALSGNVFIEKIEIHIGQSILGISAMQRPVGPLETLDVSPENLAPLNRT